MGEEVSAESFVALEAASDYGSRLRAASQLIDSTPLPALAESAPFRRVIVGFGQEASSASPGERLHALALLARLKRNGGKDLKQLATTQLKSLLATIPAPCSGITDEKSKTSIYTILAKHRASWVAAYLATEAVHEGLSDKLRVLAVAGVVLNSDTWSGALTTIADAIFRVSGAKAKPSVARSNLVRSTLSAVRASIPKAGAPGADFGEVLGRFVAELAAFMSEPGASLSHSKAALEVVLLAESAVTHRPVVAFDPIFVATLVQARNVMPEKRWLPAASKAVGSIMTKVGDIIFGFAASGIAAKELFGALEALGGSREAALKVTREFPRQLDGLPPSVITLLTEGYVPDQEDSALNDSEETMLATALLRADEFLSFAPAVSRASTSGGNPAHDLAGALATEVQSLARRRGLIVEGRPGDLVSYAPLLHRTVGSTPNRDMHVRIVIPGVVRRAEGRHPEVVMLAIVEAVES